ncbi:hypothetical protein [Fredinandcohnia sp. 179-A 10B2 NHS]|uniref:hypothetical protein n=1 Tax=Fredinandcohnia sp. 179-A 10B2 NHS TaxID=3235176 RepID=UPI0039A20F7A
MVTIIHTERLEQGICIQIEDVIFKGTRISERPSIIDVPITNDDCLLKEAN